MVSIVFEIPLCQAYLPPDGNEKRYVNHAIDSGWIMSGEYVERLEAVVAARLGGWDLQAVATSSGTAALHIAMLVADVRPGTRVLVSDLTFVAPANAIRYCGATPVFVDAQPYDWGMDVFKVDNALMDDHDFTFSAIVPVDLYGHPHNSFRLNGLGLPIIEDMTEALGALAFDKPLPVEADIACLSFNFNKLITGAGGGMLLTSNPAYAAHARHLINQAKVDGDEFDHDQTGFNYRLSNIQAAIALAQFERLDEHLAAKRRIAARYAEALGDLPGIGLMPKAPWAEPAYWLYSILTPTNSRPLIAALADAGVQSRPFFKPMHLLPMFADCEVLGGEVAERLWRTGINLPSSVGLTVKDQDRVIAAIRGFWRDQWMR